MSTLNEKIQQFEEAQRALFAHLAISRREPDGKHTRTDGLRHTTHSGNHDIPTHYPHVLDYRARQWKITGTDQNHDDEVHVKIDGAQDWEPENTIRFNVLSIWDTKPAEDPMVCTSCTHLPKPEELEYAYPDSVEAAAQGENFYGDECVLLLDPALGYSEEGALSEYFD